MRDIYAAFSEAADFEDAGCRANAQSVGRTIAFGFRYPGETPRIKSDSDEHPIPVLE